MSRHLKSHAIFLLNSIVDHYVKLPPKSAPRARGVRYFRLVPMLTQYSGKINTFKQGRKYHKHIISRIAPEHNGLFQLYTYHFPKTWSAACVANRELIKEAQRRAHALEHNYSPVALEWRLRFFKHYFRVIKGGFDPEPGFGRYARFYQYVFVAIYRDLKNEASNLQITDDDVTFSPIEQRLFQADSIRLSPRPFRFIPPLLTTSSSNHHLPTQHRSSSNHLLF